MRLNRLRMLNFRQHAETEIEFDSGLTGIIGPNGAGKTTILEAVAWALGRKLVCSALRTGEPVDAGAHPAHRKRPVSGAPHLCIRFAFPVLIQRCRAACDQGGSDDGVNQPEDLQALL